MSEITDRIRAFAATRPEGWEDLRDWLASRRYSDPARYRTRGEDEVLKADSSDFPETEEGTWDEVEEAANVGLLTDDEYLQIVRRAEELQARPDAT